MFCTLVTRDIVYWVLILVTGPLIDIRTQLVMILYIDRSQLAMIYPLDRSCLGHGFENLQDNLNIDEQLIHNVAHLLYHNVKRSCFGHPLCDPSLDRQLSGLHPLS